MIFSLRNNIIWQHRFCYDNSVPMYYYGRMDNCHVLCKFCSETVPLWFHNPDERFLRKYLQLGVFHPAYCFRIIFYVESCSRSVVWVSHFRTVTRNLNLNFAESSLKRENVWKTDVNFWNCEGNSRLKGNSTGELIQKFLTWNMSIQLSGMDSDSRRGHFERRSYHWRRKGCDHGSKTESCKQEAETSIKTTIDRNRRRFRGRRRRDGRGIHGRRWSRRGRIRQEHFTFIRMPE